MLGLIEFDIVKQCNFNCAKCCHFTPLYEGAWFKDLGEFEREIKRVAEFLHPQGAISLIGGEPFLHPQVE